MRYRIPGGHRLLSRDKFPGSVKRLAMQSSRRLRITAAHIAPRPVANESHALGGDATVCVTGAAGYVGSWITRLCLDRGYAVKACVRNVDDERKTAFLKAMPEYRDKLTLHSADMTLEGAYDDIFPGCHTVFHPAEVFMSFSPGKDKKAAFADFAPGGVSREDFPDALHANAMDAAQFLVDSINRSGTVRRLVYTASIASMMPGLMEAYIANPAVDERREPLTVPETANGYGPTKRATEHFLSYEAARSGGQWSVLTGNPADIVGPVLSPHQATETWQGKIGGIIQGIPSPQEGNGRPWMLVDARDVAEAEILLAESSTVESGERFCLSSCDQLFAETIGEHVMHLYPDIDAATEVAPGPSGEIVRNNPAWLRAHLRNDKVVEAVGMRFHDFDDTLRATVDSLIEVGGITPKKK